MVGSIENFEVKWLDPIKEKETLFFTDSKGAIKFFNSINWINCCIEYWKAYYKGDIFYNEDWSLKIKNLNDKKTLEIFVEYHNGIENTTIDKIIFVVIYFWTEQKKSSWFEKLVSKKEAKEIECNSHVLNINYKELQVVVEAFLDRNYEMVKNKVNRHFDYFDED